MCPSVADGGVASATSWLVPAVDSPSSWRPRWARLIHGQRTSPGDQTVSQASSESTQLFSPLGRPISVLVTGEKRIGGLASGRSWTHSMKNHPPLFQAGRLTELPVHGDELSREVALSRVLPRQCPVSPTGFLMNGAAFPISRMLFHGWLTAATFGMPGTPSFCKEGGRGHAQGSLPSCTRSRKWRVGRGGGER